VVGSLTRPDLNLEALPELVAAAKKVGVPLDGHTLGMIGEAHAARLLGLTLMPASTAGYDALTADGKTVEIKATTKSSVGFRSGDLSPDLIAVLQLNPETLEPSICYFGEAAPILELVGKLQSNGQRSVSLYRIAKLGRQ
jgi:hypothetical protein